MRNANKIKTMAHKVIDGKVVVDWATGDPEGDRIVLLSAYRDFINEVRAALDQPEGADSAIRELFDTWRVSTDNQVDDFPRIWIKRPE